MDTSVYIYDLVHIYIRRERVNSRERVVAATKCFNH